MINVFIPKDNINERTYAVKQMFNIIGVDCEIIIDANISDYIVKDGGFSLLIKDYFFTSFQGSREYLFKNNIPKKVEFGRNPFTTEENIPIIYGKNEICITENKIICHIDVFASTFFMLSRWEEVVVETRDNHNRFPAKESLAVKFGFIERPVVNEYCEMLWNMLWYLGCRDKREVQGYKMILTHDVDVFRMSSFRNILRSVVCYQGLHHIVDTIKGFINFKWDPYNQYSFFMEMSEKCGTISHFYFMSDDKNRYLRSKLFKTIIHEIHNRGHKIGFHPGYLTYNNELEWERQFIALQSISKGVISEGRQHVLQIDVPRSLRIWENHNMKYDSTLGYAEKSGYRCGTGNLFNLFDCLKSKELKLMEMPLVIMDVTLRRYENLSTVDASMKMDYFIQKSKKYDCPLTILFHNSNFYGDEWRGWKQVYKNLLTK